MMIEQKNNNNNKLSTFLTNIIKIETMIQFLENFIMKINKKNISSIRRYNKKIMVRTMIRNFLLHMCLDRKLFSILQNLYPKI